MGLKSRNLTVLDFIICQHSDGNMRNILSVRAVDGSDRRSQADGLLLHTAGFAVA